MPFDHQTTSFGRLSIFFNTSAKYIRSQSTEACGLMIEWHDRPFVGKSQEEFLTLTCGNPALSIAGVVTVALIGKSLSYKRLITSKRLKNEKL